MESNTVRRKKEGMVDGWKQGRNGNNKTKEGRKEGRKEVSSGSG